MEVAGWRFDTVALAESGTRWAQGEFGQVWSATHRVCSGLATALPPRLAPTTHDAPSWGWSFSSQHRAISGCWLGIVRGTGISEPADRPAAVLARKCSRDARAVRTGGRAARGWRGRVRGCVRGVRQRRPVSVRGADWPRPPGRAPRPQATRRSGPGGGTGRGASSVRWRTSRRAMAGTATMVSMARNQIWPAVGALAQRVDDPGDPGQRGEAVQLAPPVEHPDGAPGVVGEPEERQAPAADDAGIEVQIVL